MRKSALSILANGPESFAGRKIGVLVADGSNAALIAGLQAAAEQEGATVEIVAPAVGGIETSDGKRIEAGQQIDGGPSVLYDAVVLLLSRAGASELAREPAARDFVTDAYAHYKFIGYTDDAAPLLDATGVSELRDDGFIQLSGDGSAASFISACRQLRFWNVRPGPKCHADRCAWILTGRVVGRRPDHEPLMADPQPLAILSEDLVDQARRHYHERFEVGRDSQS